MYCCLPWLTKELCIKALGGEKQKKLYTHPTMHPLNINQCYNNMEAQHPLKPPKPRTTLAFRNKVTLIHRSTHTAPPEISHQPLAKIWLSTRHFIGEDWEKTYLQTCPSDNNISVFLLPLDTSCVRKQSSERCRPAIHTLRPCITWFQSWVTSKVKQNSTIL